MTADEIRVFIVFSDDFDNGRKPDWKVVSGARRRGMGVNNKKGMMKTPKIKTVRDIGRIRTLLVTLSVTVCLATLMGWARFGPNTVPLES